jgi:hypothetical protein
MKKKLFGNILHLCALLPLVTLGNCGGTFTGDEFEFTNDWSNGGLVIEDTSEWPAGLDTARNVDYLSDVEKDVILELNKLRTNPVKWCYEVGLNRLDGLSPEQEFLQDAYGRGYTKRYPLPLLMSSKGLWLAAFDNCHNNQFTKLGHSEWSGRVEGRYGNSGGHIGENAGAGLSGASGAAIVSGFVRDSGVSDKGHRINCMEADWHVVGAAVMNGWVTQDFANSFSDNEGASQCDIPFAAVKIDSAGETTAIRLTFSKPVILDNADVEFVTGTATASTVRNGSIYNSTDDEYTWYVPITTHHAGNVEIKVNKPAVKVRPWSRVIPVTKNSSFTNLDDMKTFISGQPTKGTVTDPVYVTYTGALAGDTDADKISALYAALNDAGKFVYLTITTPLPTWPAATPNTGIEKIVGIVLPMPFSGNNPVNTSIGASAFVGATALKSVYSFNVTTIGESAFSGCTALETITMSRTTSIPAGAFSGCAAVTSVCVGSNLTLSGTGLPDGMIAKYEAEGKAGGYNTSGDVTYVLQEGVWIKVN